MLKYLKRKGIIFGETKLRRVMQKYQLRARIPRAYVRTTDSNHSFEIYKNLLLAMTVTGTNWTAPRQPI